MQITKAEVIPVELKLTRPVKMAGAPIIDTITSVFVRLITRQGQSAWGCTIAQPGLTGTDSKLLVRICQDCAAKVPDLNPLNLEYSLFEISQLTQSAPEAQCAFDLAFYDLLSLAAGLPLYRLLGGYRDRIQTSVTIPIISIEESVEIACQRASQGFRILKVKGGIDPDLDVRRIRAIHRALPDHLIRLDADGGYTVRQALDVAQALENILEMLEQPTQPDDLDALKQVHKLSSIPILADQSVKGPSSALQIASEHCTAGISIKLALCGGLNNARQMDAIARAAQMTTMVSCLIEPALLIAAGLSYALASSNVSYGDLDGYLNIENDPSQPGFIQQDGWLIAADVPGLGYSVNLG